MNICIPVIADQGLKSQISAHFGSAPFFMIVDTENHNCRAISNRNLHHEHGMCQPLAALEGEALDGIVVGGIGMGALRKLMEAGIDVYLSEFDTVENTLKGYRAGTLRRVVPHMTCDNNGSAPSGCSHD